MNEFLRLLFLFLLGGMGGWVIELFFRRFVSAKKWVNPGFLSGPLLPLYGFGLACLYVLSSLDFSFGGRIEGAWQAALCVISIGVAMTLVEFIAGIIFIRGMKIQLWDYSDRWGNVLGVICPLFSLIWCLIGAFYYFVCHKAFVAMTDCLLQAPVLLAFGVGIVSGFLIVDLAYSFHLAVRIRKAVSNSKLVVSWERAKESFREHYEEAKQRRPYLFAFSDRNHAFKEMVDEYVDKAMSFNEKRVRERMIRQEVKKMMRKRRIAHLFKRR